MAKFKYSPTEDDDHRAYLLVDDIFDISLLRTEEGLIVNTYQGDDYELIGTLVLDNPRIGEAQP